MLEAEEKWAEAEKNLGQRQICCLSLLCVQRPGARRVGRSPWGDLLGCLGAKGRHVNKEWGSHPQQMQTGRRVGMGRRKETRHRSRQRGSQDTGILGHRVDSWLERRACSHRSLCASEKNTILQVRGQLPCTHACMRARFLSPSFPRKTAGDKARTHSSRQRK